MTKTTKALPRRKAGRFYVVNLQGQVEWFTNWDEALERCKELFKAQRAAQ